MRGYEVEDLIDNYRNKELFTVIIELGSEVKQLDIIARNVKKRKDISEYKFNDYRNHAGDFLFFLTCGIVPAGIGLQGLRKFLPVIEYMVEKGNLVPETLDLFEKKIH